MNQTKNHKKKKPKIVVEYVEDEPVDFVAFVEEILELIKERKIKKIKKTSI